jgi:uncharacterized protein YbcC (UPF0753/DUF2309 family)
MPAIIQEPASHGSGGSSASHGSRGNKLLQNAVAGRIGVFEGDGRDLRIGRAQQSLVAGTQ